MMKQFAIHIWQLSGVLLIAGMGGVARAISEWSKGKRYTATQATAEIFLAIFAGLIVHWIASDLSLPEGIRTAMVALAGYSSRAILEILNTAMIKWIKVEVKK